MALSPQDRADFINAFTRALITAWSSEEYSARLESQPVEALREVGVHLPEGADVQVSRAVRDEPGGQNELDEQVDLYESGLATGHFVFHIPETPQLDTSELTEGELDDIAAGWSVGCCCCPCCCCT